jgi:hypothetical protein
MLDSWGYHSDDRERPPQQRYSTTDDARIAVEAALPQPVTENHDLIRLAIRQRFEQHAVKHTENRRVSADAQAERDDGDQGEARILE